MQQFHTTARVTSDSEFQSRIDDADPHVCSQEELQGLLNDAPDAYSQGYLAGVFNSRQMRQILTNRAF